MNVILSEIFVRIQERLSAGLVTTCEVMLGLMTEEGAMSRIDTETEYTDRGNNAFTA